MSAVLIVCAATIIGGLILAVWLKREGERSWQRRRALIAAAERREQMKRLTAGFIQFQVSLRDNLTPALQKTGAEMRRMADALRESQR